MAQGREPEQAATPTGGGPDPHQVSIRVRRARPDDALAVARVHVRSWQAGYRGLMPQDFLDGLRAEDRAGHYTFGGTDPGAPHTDVAVRVHRIVGFATTGPARDEDARGAGALMALYVDPDSWGLGVGRALLRAGRLRLAREGCVEAVLWVLARNDRARRFYEADGWAADGSSRTEEVWGATADMVRYRRRTA